MNGCGKVGIRKRQTLGQQTKIITTLCLPKHKDVNFTTWVYKFLKKVMLEEEKSYS